MAAPRNPILGAAVLKLTLERQGADAALFSVVYEGTLRDLGLRDEDVDAYLREHRDEVEARLPAELRCPAGS
jgi:hypothetical protein